MATGQGQAGKIQLRQERALLKARTPFADLAWDLSRGGVLVQCALRRNGVAILDARAGGPAPDVVIAASRTLEEKHHEIRLSRLGRASVEVLHAEDGSIRLNFAAQDKEIRIERALTLDPGSPWIEEEISLQNVSAYDLLIDRYPDWEAAGKTAVAGDLFHWNVNPGGVDYLLSGVRINGDWDETEYVLPASGYPFFYNRGRFKEMGKTAISLVAGHHGAVLPCIMVYNEKVRSGVLLSCIHDRCLRYVRMYGDPKSRAGTVTAQVWWARWLSPGEKREVAAFQLVPFTGDYSHMLDEYRHWLGERHNIKPPSEQAPKIDEMFVAQIHSVALHSLGHFSKFKPYVDAVKRAGCTAIWAPHGWLDSCDIDRRAWMSRCQPQTRDFHYGVTTAYGGEKAFHDILAHIHRKGLKYVAWVTGYGLTGFDPLYRDYPEAFVRLRQPVKVKSKVSAKLKKLLPHFDVLAGRPNDWIYPPFGGCTIGGDTTHYAWRKFWLNNQEYWAAHGVDGIFIDSFNPMPPNYALRPWPGQIGLEIINLQREARRLARQKNPDYFTFTEGGGYLMASVNDFTHTYHGCDAPPLPPYRKRALSPEEEARFCFDEALSMLPGARSWGIVQHDSPPYRPRVLGRMFGRALPVIPMFTESQPCKPITNEIEYWAWFKVRPADAPGEASQRSYDWIGKLWRLRQSHPELKSGNLDVWAVKCSDPAVFAFLRRKGRRLSVVALNFRQTAVSCKLSLDLKAAGLTNGSKVRPRNLLADQHYAPCSGAALARGIRATIPARDAVVLKLEKR